MRTLKFKKFLESNWLADLNIEAPTNLASVSDDYYQMELIDITPHRKGMMLDVVFYEKSNTKLRGTGKFKFIESNIETLKGDIIPMRMTGILEDVFDENEEAVLEFLYRLMDIINNK